MPSALEVVEELEPREGAADPSAATQAVKQASGPVIRASKSRPRRR
jgi:hypothetical protein